MRTKTPLGVDLFYDGKWNPVPMDTDVWPRDPLTISRGRTSETKRVRPTLVTATFGNVARKYSPRNPASPLFGKIRRNTPMRVYTTLFSDTFDRTVAGAWGTAPDSAAQATGRVDRAWASTGIGSGSISVGAGVGVHTQTTTAGYRLTVLDDVEGNRWRDCEIRAKFTLSGTGMPNVAGGSIEPGNLLLRRIDSNNYYFVRVEITTAEAVNISIKRILANIETTISSVVLVPGLTFTGQALMVAFQAEGSVLAAKVWDPAVGEPYDYQVTAVDTTMADPGLVGVRTGVQTGNTNVPLTANYDDFEVRVPAAFVEVEAWPQRQSLDGKDRWVPIRASGLTKRLSATGAGITDRSVMRRFYDFTSPAPAAYWSMASPISERGGLSVTRELWSPDLIAWSGGAVAPWLPEGYESNQKQQLECTIRDGPLSSTQATLDWVMRLDPPVDTSGSASLFFRVLPETGVAGLAIIHLETRIDAGVPAINLFNIQTGFSTIGATVATNVFDGLPHSWRITVVDAGVTTTCTVYLDGVQILTHSSNTVSWQSVRGATFAPQTAGAANYAFGHVALYAVTPPAVVDVYTAMTGYSGEQADNRVARLAAEEDIPVAVVGTIGERLGPQRAIPALESMFEAADADLGVLYEPRGRPGLTFETRRSLYSVAPTVALDFAAGNEVASPSEGSEDLDFVVNDLTVSRSYGGEFTYRKISGPLNANDPADDLTGVGQYRPAPVELSLADDAQLEPQARFRVHVGTWDEGRYPGLVMSPSMLHEAGKTAKVNAVAGLDLSDHVLLSTPPSGAYTEDQQLLGTYEEFESHRWRKEVTTSPYGPNDPGKYAANLASSTRRYDSLGSTLAAPVLSGTATSLQVAIAAGDPLWTLTPGNWVGLQVESGGVIWSVTSITGSASPQTINVTQAPVNGVIKVVPFATRVRVAPALRGNYGL